MKKILDSFMTKAVVSAAILGASTSLMAMYGEHAYLYKDPRVMAMGGANVAVGGYSTSVFSNPAGLASIRKDHGIVVDLLGVGVSASAQFNDFYKDSEDMNEAGLTDDEKTKRAIELLEDYAGDHLHLGVDNYTAISKNSDKFAWSIGLLTAADVNIVTHANGSVNGGFLETTSRAYGGVVVGIAKEYPTDNGRLDVGLSVKYLQQSSVEGSLGISELTDENDNLATKLEDKYRQDSTGVGLDIGVKYYPLTANFLNPTLGLSVLNIGNMGMDDNYGGQPMTINVGAAISTYITKYSHLTLAVDYVDLLDENKVRLYGMDGAKTDYDESDYMKRLRLGASLNLIDTRFISTTINGGWYQEAYTAGLDLQILLFKLNVATYQEQVGVGEIDISDRRYLAKIAIGW